MAIEDQPGRRVELALDLAAFAFESQFLGHLQRSVNCEQIIGRFLNAVVEMKKDLC